MRKELFWDRDPDRVTPEVEIERAINFGGFAYIDEVRKKHGEKAFLDALMNDRNLGRKAVNYWCLVLGIDRNQTAAFSKPEPVWTPIR
ncbi:MAG: hypothetical protein ACYDH0_07995 [Candidatus Aminicenantales bacterium]